MQANPIISICLKGFPGANRALSESSRALGMTRHITVASPRPDGAEVAFLVEHLRENSPPALLFGGWSPVYQEILSRLGKRRPRSGVLWTSSGAQVDMSDEAEKLAQVLTSPHVEQVFCSSASLASTLAVRRAGVSFLPLTFAERAEEIPADRDEDEGDTRLSLFFPAPELRRKNALNCLLAAAASNRDCTLYLNGLSQRPDYRALMERLRLRFRDFGWMDGDTYRAVLGRVQIGLQPSFAESYSYVAAEHALRGIPVLATPMVPALEGLPEDLSDVLVVSRADDAVELSRRIVYLVDRPGMRREIGARLREWILAANRLRVDEARRIVRNWLRDEGRM